MEPKEIKKMRESAGLNQIEFASLFGVHYQTVQRWEQGRKTPTLPQEFMLEKIAQKLKGFKGAHVFIIRHGVSEFLDALT